jgi:hypothetical protein
MEEKRKVGRPKAVEPREETYVFQVRLTPEDRDALNTIVRGKFKSATEWLKSIIRTVSIKDGRYIVFVKGVAHFLTKQELKQLHEQTYKLLIK